LTTSARGGIALNINSDTKQIGTESVFRRIDIDLFRGFGIMLMIMGHVGFGEHFDKWIHAFHMPIFFFMSGFFYQKIPMKNYILKKAKALLIPYCTVGILHCVLYCIKENIISFSPFLKLLFNTIDGGVPIAGALWFLTALFFMEIIYYIIDCIAGKNITIITLAISVLFSILESVFYVYIPLAIGASLSCVIFFHFGRSYKNKKVEVKRCLLIPMLVAISICIFINGEVNIKDGSFSFIPLFYVNAIGMSIIGYELFGMLAQILQRADQGVATKCVKYLSYIGRHSIVFLCFNQLMILINSKAMMILCVKGFLSKIIVLIFTLVELTLVTYIFCKNRILLKIIGK